jgi:hypothetical protein
VTLRHHTASSFEDSAALISCILHGQLCGTTLAPALTMRRAMLFVGCLGIAATAPSRVHAGTEVEADGFVGTTPGAWACGPVTRVNYGGGGARVRVTQENAPLGGKGLIAEVGGAAVSEANHFVRCTDDDSCDRSKHVMPAARFMFGGNARIGYQWKRFGIEGGADAFQFWDDNKDTTPTIRVIPDVQVSFRHKDVVKIMAGLGSPTVTTLTRPGLYVGSRVPISFVELEAYAGAFRTGPTTSPGFRMDVATSVAVTPALKVRLGASASEDESLAGYEGSAGLVVDL